MKTIDVASEFSRYPDGRVDADGPFNGAAFRSKLLVPAIAASLISREKVVVRFDGTRGVSSSFLDEAFGGLSRTEGFGSADLAELLQLESEDSSIPAEIKEYILEGVAVA